MDLMRVNPEIPWEEFEKHVKDVLTTAGGSVVLKVEGKRSLGSGDNEYEVDAYAELELFGGAIVKVIIECKCYKQPVNRDLVLALNSKVQDLGAHKGMLFATSGFQRGAISYAKRRGIALVKLADGRATYFAKSERPLRSWPTDLPKFVALLRQDIGAYTVLGPDNPSAFPEWLQAPLPSPSTSHLGEDDDSRPDIDADSATEPI